MQSNKFKVTTLYVGEIEDADTYVVMVGDQKPEPQEWLQLQRSLVEDDQDVELGMDTYCLVMSAGPVHYGGVTSCVLTEQTLRLELDQLAAQVTQTLAIELHLDLDKSDLLKLREGLEIIFADRRPSHWQLD